MEEVKYLILDNGVEIPVATTDYPWVSEWDWRWDNERHQPVAGPEDNPLFLYTEIIRVHVKRGGTTRFCLPTPRLVALTNKHLEAYGYYRRFAKDLEKLCKSLGLNFGNVANVYGMGLGRALGMYLGVLEQGDENKGWEYLGEFLEAYDLGDEEETFLDVVGLSTITELVAMLMSNNPGMQSEQTEALMDSNEFQRLVFAIVNLIGNYPLE